MSDTNPLPNDYAQVAADVGARDTLYSDYKTFWGHFMTMFGEMKSGHMNPDELINYFFYVLMPTMLGKTQDTLTIVGDQLNVLSDYRSMIAEAQSKFNAFSQGKGDDTDYTDLKDALQHILDGLGLDKGNSTVLDQSTSAEIKAAVDALIGTGGALIPPSGTDPATYLNDMWNNSKDPSDKTGASQEIKTITDQFNTVNTGSSTFSQAKQTKIQYESSAYQQQMGLDNNTLQNRAKFNSAIVQNEKSS